MKANGSFDYGKMVDKAALWSSLLLQYLIAMQSKRKYRLNAEAILAIRATLKMVRAKLADDPYFKDVLAFDPEVDVPQPSAEAKIRERMGDVADRIGLAPNLAYAIRKTGLVVTDRGKHLLDDAQCAAWNEAIDEYNRLAKRPQ